VGYTYGRALHGIHTACYVGYINIINRDVGTAVQVNANMRGITDPAIGDMDIVAVPEVEAYLVAAVDAIAFDGDIVRVIHPDRGNGLVRMAKILGMGIQYAGTCY